MTTNLRTDALNSILWSAIERFGQQGVQFVISIVLARVLAPEDFGLIAMLAIFIAFGQSFIDSGFQKALIQKKRLTVEDSSSVFFLNIGIAAVLSISMYGVAPLLSNFYNEPGLIPIARTMSLVLIFTSFGLVQDALLNKQLAFEQLFKVNITSAIAAGLVSILMAMNGYEVWSLLFMHVGGNLFRTILLWYFSTWRPTFAFRLDSVKSMYHFGSRLFLVSISNAIFTNIYQVLIGKYYSAELLGFYSRAKNLSLYPVTLISGIVNQVSFPVFARLQEDQDELKLYIQKSLRLITMITMPIMVIMIVVAKPLVVLLLTEKWLPMVPYLQLLCITGIFYPIHIINLNSLNAIGRSDLYLKIDLINKGSLILLIVLTYQFGIITMIYGQIINSIFAFYLYSYYTGRNLKYSVMMQLNDIFPSIVMSITMGLLIYLLSFLLIESQILLLFLQVISGLVIYTVLCYLFRKDIFTEISSIIKHFISRASV